MCCVNCGNEKCVSSSGSGHFCRECAEIMGYFIYNVCEGP